MRLVALYKNVRIGKGPSGNIFCKIRFENKRLSIVGVEGPYPSGNCCGGFGQIYDSIDLDKVLFSPGWTPGQAVKFLGVWKDWHLNDMRAGSPAQQQWLKANPIEVKYPASYYETACERLAAAGLNPDNGYQYGSKWLFEPVPDDVLQFLVELPDTDITPAWI